MSASVRPHRRQPTRLLCPLDSPGKNTGVGCHFLLQCVKVKSESEVAQSCLTPSDPMDCSPPGSSVHGIFQARVLEWGAIAFSDSSLAIYILYRAYIWWQTNTGKDAQYCPLLLLLFSCSVMINSLWPHRLQHARLPCPLPSPGACSNSCPLSQWCHRTILFLYHPLLLLSSIFPSSRIFFNESALGIRWQKYWSFSISPSNEYSGLISFYDWLIWPPFNPREYQESSPTPQFKRINSSALNLF